MKLHDYSGNIFTMTKSFYFIKSFRKLGLGLLGRHLKFENISFEGNAESLHKINSNRNAK